MAEDEMVGWYHQLDGHEFEQVPGVGDGQGSLLWCRPLGHKMTELNWNFPGLSEKWMWVYHMTTPPPPWPRHILQQYKVAEAGSSYLHPHPTIKFSVCVSNLPSWLSLVTATSWVPLLIDKLVVLILMLIAERVVSSKFVSGFLRPS